MTYLEACVEKAKSSKDVYATLRDALRDYASKHLAQGSKERSRLTYLKREIVEGLARDGFLRIGLKPELGGICIDHVSMGLVFEEISKVDFSASILILNHILINEMIRHVEDCIRKEWLPRFLTGQSLVCFANTEPDCGSDATAIRTRAERKGAFYIITGEKTSISLGMQAHVAVLTAKTDLKAGPKGITLFMVPLDLHGISREVIEDMGNLPIGRASIYFDGVKVPHKYRIGQEGEGFKNVMHMFNLSRVLVALSAIGMAEACLEDAIQCAKGKTLFGKPLAKYETVSFKIAEVKTLLTASRLLCFHALTLRDRAEPHHEEAAMAKWFASTQAVSVIHELLAVLGFEAYTDAMRLEERLRDAISTLIGDGTEEIMKLIIAREIFGREMGPEL
jgi:cyclohexanecarboxyl-CoA dehydrogenase